MKTVNVAEIEGAALDWAVAQIDDRDLYDLNWRCIDGEMLGFGTIGSSPEFVCFRIGKPAMFGSYPLYSPSTDWSQVGPLISSLEFGLAKEDDGSWSAIRDMDHFEIASTYPSGPTPLIAACRAIVAAKFGDTVEVPEELL